MMQMAAAGTRPILVQADVSQQAAVGARFERVLAEHGRGRRAARYRREQLARSVALPRTADGVG